ncbi:BRISC and BRCA1-A complex member 2-like [Styela clava]
MDRMDEICEMDVFPWIEPLLSRLTEADLNLCAGKASLKDFTSSTSQNSSETGSEECDIFTICIPFAGATLQWRVLFDGLDCEELPDFLISDQDGFDPDYEDIPHLINWNSKESDSLLNVLKDLLKLYKKHHLKLLSEADPKLSKNVEEVLASNEYPFLDACVVKEEDRYGSPRFTFSVLVQIQLDSSQIPDICFKDSPPIDPGFLQPVLFIRSTANSGKIVPQLYMPPRMEHVLGGRNAMKLPHYSRQNTILLEYIQSVHKNLQELVALLKNGHSKRREYVASLLCQFSSNILEYDAEDFRKISLMFSHEDFYFLVHVTLSRLFPQEQPKLIFQSAYHVTKRGELYQVTHSNYPYSPRWTGSEMVKRARAYILERIEAFKTGCMKNGII